MRTFDDIRKYLNFLAQVQRSQHPDWKYGSYEELILDVGHEFELDITSLLGKPRECYKNAMTRLLVESDSQEFYCEGWGVTTSCVIPVQHAWTANKHRFAIESTWDTSSALYIGVPMNFNFAMSFMVKNGHYGVFGNDWNNGFEILKYGLPEGAIAY